jgi:hypothetical protein
MKDYSWHYAKARVLPYEHDIKYQLLNIFQGGFKNVSDFLYAVFLILEVCDIPKSLVEFNIECRVKPTHQLIFLVA